MEKDTFQSTALTKRKVENTKAFPNSIPVHLASITPGGLTWYHVKQESRDSSWLRCLLRYLKVSMPRSAYCVLPNTWLRTFFRSLLSSFLGFFATLGK